MEKQTITIEQREAALSQQQAEKIQKQRRRRINLYKNLIVTLVCMIAISPVCISLYLLSEITKMEKDVTLIAKERLAEQTLHLSNAQNATQKSGSLDGSQSQSDEESSLAQQSVAPGKRVYLTFDDGPSENTDEILEILEKNNVKATFFVIGHTDEASKQRYQNIVNGGHSIGIHSYTHDYKKIYASLKSFQKDVTKMSNLIYKTTGIRTKLYRFPGGSSNTVSKVNVDDCIRWLDANDYIYFDWNALNGDAVTKDLSPATLANNIINNVKTNEKNGVDSVVLMHDMTVRHNTVDSLQSLIDTLKQQGFVMDQPLSVNVEPVQQKKLEE